MLGSASAAAPATAAMQLVRALATSTAASQSALPAVATKSGGGLASLFGFGSARIDTPLSEALPSLPKPLKGSVPATAPALQTGSLTAGTKVAAVDGVSPVSAVSLVFGAGPATESGASLGSSRVLEALAFRATSNRTTFRLTRELEKIGAVASAKAGRDHLAFTLSAVKLHTPEAVETLIDSVLNAKLNYWEVQEGLQVAKAALTAELRDPINVLADALHRAAFDGGLGQPLHIDPSLIDGITHDSLREYLATTLNPAKAVLAGASVGLQELTALANPLVPGGSSAAGASASGSYIGGSLSVLAPTSPLTYVGLGIEAKGGLASAKAAATAAILRAALDDGRAVLPRTSKEHDVVRAATGYSSMFARTGVVGLIAASAPAQAPALLDYATKKLAALAKPLPDVALKAAKQVVVGAYRERMSTSAGLVGVAAPALLATGAFAPSEFVGAVESVTAADLAAFVAAGLKGKPTLVTYGSMSTRLPSSEDVAKQLAA
jgi:processing peptidase subunit alpha